MRGYVRAQAVARVKRTLRRSWRRRHRRPRHPRRSRSPPRCSARGWSVSWLGTRTAWRTELVPPHGIALDTHRLRRPARQGPAAHAAGALRAARRVLAAACASCARARAGRRARHGRLRLLPGRHDGRAAAAGRWCSSTPTRRCCCSNRVLAAGRRPRRRSASPARLRRRRAQGDRDRQPGARRRSRRCRRPARASPAAAARCACSSSAAAWARSVLNERVPQALALLDAGARPRVMHQTGEANHRRRARRVRDAGVDGRSASPSSTTWRRATPMPTSSSAAPAR